VPHFTSYVQVGAAFSPPGTRDELFSLSAHFRGRRPLLHETYDLEPRFTEFVVRAEYALWPMEREEWQRRHSETPYPGKVAEG